MRKRRFHPDCEDLETRIPLTIAGGTAPFADQGELFLNQYGDALVSAAINHLGDTDAWAFFFDSTGSGTAVYRAYGSGGLDLEMGAWDGYPLATNFRDYYNDDYSGLDPQITATVTQIWPFVNTVQVGEYGDDATGDYTLAINGPTPIVGNITFSEPAGHPGRHFGTISSAVDGNGDVDYYTFTAPSQGRYSITVTPTPGGVGIIDATLIVFDALGGPLVGDYANDVDSTGPGLPERVSIFLRRGQTAAVRVADYGNDTTGNYRVDVGGFRSNVGMFRSGLTIQDWDGTYSYNVSDYHFAFGQVGDRPIAGNFTGTGNDLFGVYRNGLWLIDLNDSKGWNAGDVGFSFGLATDHPVVGDIDNDGFDEVGVFRNGLWLFDANNTGVWDAGDIGFVFGQAGDIPVMHDWNGDGQDDAGVFRGGVFLLDANGSRGWNAGDVGYAFGYATDIPVVGDWNGNGLGQVGVYRNGIFYLDRNGTGTWDVGDVGIQYGQAGDLPVVGQWWDSGALTAAALPEVGHEAGAGLTAEQLAPLVEQAILMWQASGLDASAVALLRGTEFRIGDLPGAELGRHLGGAVIVDANAAGWGWFVDPTPAAHEEFTAATAEGLLAETTPAAGRMDLLTVLAHELGHTLDLADQAGGFTADHVMTGTLPAGVRRLPE